MINISLHYLNKKEELEITLIPKTQQPHGNIMNNNEKDSHIQKDNPIPFITRNLYIDNLATDHNLDNVVMGFKDKTGQYVGGYYLTNNSDTIAGVGLYLMILETIESVYYLDISVSFDSFGRKHVTGAKFVTK